MSSKILVVDDLQSELDLLCQYLTEEGYTIVTGHQWHRGTRKS